MKATLHYFTLILLLFSFDLTAQRKGKAADNTQSLLADSTFNGLKFRNIGPGFMSGRIADIAIHPTDFSTWYVAVGSGGVWKTINAGTTWTPVFDKQPVYSIGCVTIDHNNPNLVWVGTGENVGGRHVGYGDGIYLSKDGGANWANMGLKNSEHISKILVHPNNSNIVFTAVQGPLWSKGGERGFYKTTDGGKTWKRTLGDDEWVGVTDIAMDPRDPNLIYAATWQRHRTVADYMGGGPGTAIYRSADGGETWTKLTKGLPKSNMGKIGIAISPQRPDVVYAAIELDRRTGGIYKSVNQGATWEKQSNAVSGATGPHYYQELYASPHKYDRIYLMDTQTQVSEDGGKTVTTVNVVSRHVDDHALAFRPDDPDYLLFGTDGGLYESFDLGKSWKYVDNLPVTQFYKVAVDDAEPFYNIYGGTQDNSTQGGPSRTDNVHGIQNSDWKIVLNWDGHQPATEPGNPNIIYAERQEGNISRVDITTGEVVDIQPQPGPEDPHERYNWDAPILVSPHNPTTIYFASYRVWKSEDRGDNWTAISPDLTSNQNRITLPIMGRQQSWDNAWDLNAMSNYNTITSLAESPVKQGVIYAGTDDGMVQVTEDGGSSWRKIPVGDMPGVPSTAFVNDIKADLYDENTVYVALDNHKYGDFRPMLMKSSDKGRSWSSIASNIPDGTLVWRLVQDHVNPNLMFAATEFGIYFTINGGSKWTKLQGGVPTISFRDLAIQKRENDLVGASFGRGFFILDDYVPLRQVSEKQLASEATLFPARKAWWYIQRPQLSLDNKKGSQGDAHYVASNPDFGAVFTYYLKDGLKSKKEQRQENEKIINQESNIPFPGWEAVEAERNEPPPNIWLSITDANGNTIRRINGPVQAGFHRVAWDLTFPAPNSIDLKKDIPQEENGPSSSSLLAAPGAYTAHLFKEVDGVLTELSQPQDFEVIPLHKGALETADPAGAVAFYRAYETAYKQSTALQIEIRNALDKIKAMQIALKRSNASPGELDARLFALRSSILALDSKFSGNRAKSQPGEKTKPTIPKRLSAINRGISRSTYGPTGTNRATMVIVQRQLSEIQTELSGLHTKMDSLMDALIAAGAPFVK
jgi:photosystem II stability/assembly factor-like uncharacterized protein